MLKGIIDIEKESQKLSKNKESLLKQIDSLKKLMTADGYEAKVPEAVREKNSEKVKSFDQNFFREF
jgi:valyl-tRNA synthetase